MFSTDNAADYLERAEMHEQLADATGDEQARKMHQSMAEAYRRKAADAGVIRMVQPEPVITLHVAA
jgi:hypothetical protein